MAKGIYFTHASKRILINHGVSAFECIDEELEEKFVRTGWLVVFEEGLPNYGGSPAQVHICVQLCKGLVLDFTEEVVSTSYL